MGEDVDLVEHLDTLLLFWGHTLLVVELNGAGAGCWA